MKQIPMTSFTPTPDDYLKSVFDRDLRRKINAWEAGHPAAPIVPTDLNQVPREQWDDCIFLPLAFPPDVQLYMDATQGEPLTLTECLSIENRMEKFYGVTEPYCIFVTDRIATLGQR